MKALSARTHLPYDPSPKEVTREVKAIVARGEMASVSFSIESQTTVDDLEVFGNPLFSGSGADSGIGVDLHVVHRWRQAGLGVFQSSPVEVGELLLKDDRVHLRDRYVHGCGNLFHIHKSGTRYSPPDVRLTGPVRTSIASGSAKQFWVSITVPPNIFAGTYEGSIVARHAGKTVLELRLTVGVLDVLLAAPSRRTMMWYRGTINCHHPHHYVRPKVFAAQLADIFSHGFRDISLWETDPQRLQSAIDVAQSVGFCGDVVLDGFREKLWSAVNFGKLRPVAYVSDELDGHGFDRYAGHVESMHAAKQNGVRTMASVLDWRTAVQTIGDGPSGSRPDVVSVYAPNNCAELTSRAARAEDHGDVYFYWQAHMEKPLVHRVLAGLLLWKSGADGISPYCYQHLPGIPHSPFDDFDPWDSATHTDSLGRRFKDHMATYPARHGVIHTVQWKGLADGITDLRYLATLEKAIDEVERGEDASWRERGAIARRNIEATIDRLPWPDLDILSETSAAPFPNFSGGEMQAVRSEMVEALSGLTRSVSVER